MENPFIKKVREGQFKMLFGVSAQEAKAIFSGGGGGFIAGGDEGAHYQMPERQYSDFISDRKATIESFLASCGSRAVGLEITIRSSDGTHITAKLD